MWEEMELIEWLAQTAKERCVENPTPSHYEESRSKLSVCNVKFWSLSWIIVCAMYIQGSSYLLGQRFSAYFVLKLPPQRGEGEKRRECKFQN